MPGGRMRTGMSDRQPAMTSIASAAPTRRKLRDLDRQRRERATPQLHFDAMRPRSNPGRHLEIELISLRGGVRAKGVDLEPIASINRRVERLRVRHLEHRYLHAARDDACSRQQ